MGQSAPKTCERPVLFDQIEARPGRVAEVRRAGAGFFYLEDRERTLNSPTDKIMLSLTAFADELERARGRHRTTDAMIARPGPAASLAATRSATATSAPPRVTSRETLATAAVEGGRALLREVLSAPLMFQPSAEGYTFRGPVILGQLIAGAINEGVQQAGTHKVSSPMGFIERCSLPFRGVAA